MGYLNVDGLTHLWSKVKGLSDLKIKKTDVMTNEEIDELFEGKKLPVGGAIFYDAGDNGATNTFYDSSGSIISDASITGLQSAKYYTVEGTPTSDRFYVVYPSLLNGGNYVHWGFYCNADIKDFRGNIVNTGTAIGTGKTNTQAILNYIDTYASSETASSSKPSSDISQASPNGYNLYKNCGTDYNYLWDIIRDVNSDSFEGHNDWFVPSKNELQQIGTSKVISSITGSNYICSSSAYDEPEQAWSWTYSFPGLGGEGMIPQVRYITDSTCYKCIICRAF